MKQNLLLIFTDYTKSRGAVNALMGRPDIQRILKKLRELPTNLVSDGKQ